MLVEGVKDPRIGFVTVTEVRLTDDLRTAQAYVSMIGSDAQQHESLTGLRAAAGFLKRELGRRLDLRFVPQIFFAYDATLKEAQRLDQLLTAAGRGEPEAPANSETGELPQASTARQIAGTLPSGPPVRRRKKARRKAAPGARKRGASAPLRP